MIGQYKGFIHENCAPPNVSTISIYDTDGVKKASMGVPSFMRYPNGTKLYSFGIISDVHIVNQTSGQLSPWASLKFNNALSWFEEQGASFVCIPGDITNHGFANSDGSLDLTQFAEYKRLCDLHPSLPIYPCGGNHDSYFVPLTENEAEWKVYTGQNLYYMIEQGNDLFILISQPTNTAPMSDDAFDWLSATLQASGGRRCFIFVHPFLSGDSGNPKGTYHGALLSSWTRVSEFLNLLRQYPNVMLLHGHSHFNFHNQEIENTAVYTEKNGFRSMHIPSVTAPAIIASSGDREQIATESYGYLVDVFEDCVVFRSRDFGIIESGTFVNPQWLPISTYKINMPEVIFEGIHYSVTNNLDNCTNSNTELYILEGESYSATITPNDWYEISSITVTMGNIDVTNSVVDGNTITISEVTGNIVINVTTIALEKPLINEIPISTDVDGNLYVGTNGEAGYKTGYRLSSSSGGESVANGIEVTGFIPAKLNDTLYIKGITIGDGSTGYENIVFYDANKTYITGGYASTIFGIVNGEVASGVISQKAMSKLTDSVAYMRISAQVINEDSFLSVNKEITEDIYYSIINTLTNCTNNNSIASILEGESYSATINPNSGYSLNNITVTMGGTDITSTAVNNNTITITSVTGNIVIVASATKDTVYYSVSNNLTNCTSSNSATSIAEGEPYSATITANDGYEMSSISVVMGGTNISASAVSDRTVTISNVTGNVTITAEATEVEVGPTYQQCEWIKNDDRASYIDLGITNTESTGISMKFELSALSSSYGMSGIFGNTDIACGLNGRTDMRGYHGQVKSYQLIATAVIDTEYTVGINYQNNGVASFNETNKSWNSGAKTFAKSETITICKQNGGTNYANEAYVKIKEIYISEGAEVTKHFVPAYRVVDNVCGLLETNSGEFIAAIGNFSCGADV